MLDRYKRNIEGFRNYVSFLETSPPEKFLKFIEMAKQEDAAFVNKALKYVISFDDILKMPDMEFTEVFINIPALVIAHAMGDFTQEEKENFVKRLHAENQLKVIQEMKDLTSKPGQIAGARIKIITEARALEKKNAINLKKIPYLLEEL